MNAPLASCCFHAGDVPAPRFREVGDLTLDRLHQDARVEDRWLRLQPREFALLWQLAERPGERVEETRLAADLRRLRTGGGSRDIAADAERLRASLRAVGLAQMLISDGTGGYCLAIRATLVAQPDAG